MSKTTQLQPQAGFLSTFARLISPMRALKALGDVWRLARERRELTMELARRDMGSAHASHALGASWIYLHPVLIALVFMTVFGVVFGSKIHLPKGFPGDYSAYILIGLIPWLMIQAALSRSTGALTGNSNLVKQVVFPIEVLPLGTVISSTLPYVPAMVLAVGYSFYMAGTIPVTVVLLPLVILMHMMLSIGIGYILAALTAFMRDLREFVVVFCLIAMYITPAVYLEEWVPELLRPLLYFNPFSYLIWVYQDTLFYGQILHPEAWWTLAAMSILTLAGGWRLFAKLKPFYGNVL